MGSMKYKIDIDFQANNLAKVKAQLNQALETVTKDGVKVGFDQNSISQMKKDIRTVSDLYEKSFNQSTNKLDTISFAKGLNQSKIDFTKLNEQSQALGINGMDAFKNITKSAYNFDKQAEKSVGLLGKLSFTLMNTFRWRVSNAALNALSGQVSQAYYFAKDLDASLTNIRIVAGQTHDEMLDFAKEANEAAKELKTTTVDYTNAALIYYQQGMKAADVTTMTRATIMAANISQSTTEEMSNLLTSTMNGYKLGTESAIKVTDTLAAVGASSAADFYELATAMSKVSSVAQTAGIPMESLTAQIATIVSVTKQAPETVGHALKTVYTRMLAFKNQSTEMMTDDDGETFGVPAVESALARFNNATGTQISLFEMVDGVKQLRNLDKVIEDIGNSWDKTTDKSAKFGLATSLAGTRQQNNLIALFDTWDMYEKQLDVAMESEGTTLRQNALYMDSYAGHLKEMQAAKEDLYMNLFTSDDIKPLLDGLTFAFKMISNITENIGGLPSILILSASLMGKFSNTVKKTSLGFFGIRQSFDTINSLAGTSIKAKGGTEEQASVDIIKRSYSEDEVAKMETATKALQNIKAHAIQATAELQLLQHQYIEFEDINQNMTGELDGIIKNVGPENDSILLKNLVDGKSQLKPIEQELLKIKELYNGIENMPGKVKIAYSKMDKSIKNQTGSVGNLVEQYGELEDAILKAQQISGKKSSNNSDFVVNSAESIDAEIKRLNDFAATQEKSLADEIKAKAKIAQSADTARLALSSLAMVAGTLFSVFTEEGVPASEKLSNALVGIAPIALMNIDSFFDMAKSSYAMSAGAIAGAGALTKLKSGLVAITMAATKFTLVLAAISAAVWGISFLVKKFDDSHISFKEQQQIAEDASNAYQEAKSELDSLNASLETNKKRIEEINNLDNPTYVDDAEKLKLENSNKALEQQIKFKQTLADMESGKASVENTKTANYKEKVKVYKKVKYTDPTIAPEYGQTDNQTGVDINSTNIVEQFSLDGKPIPIDITIDPNIKNVPEVKKEIKTKIEEVDIELSPIEQAKAYSESLSVLKEEENRLIAVQNKLADEGKKNTKEWKENTKAIDKNLETQELTRKILSDLGVELSTYQLGITDVSTASVQATEDIQNALNTIEDAVYGPPPERSEEYYNKIIGQNRNMVAKFAENYKIDVTQYKTLISLKQNIEKGFYSNVKNISDDLIEKLAKNYGVDLSHFSTNEQKKLAIAKAAQNSIIKMSGVGAGKNLAEVSNQLALLSVRKQKDTDEYKELDKWYTEQLKNQKENEAAMAEINRIFNEYINSSIVTPNPNNNIGGGDGTKGSAIDPQDMTASFIKGANYLAEQDQLMSKLLEKNIKTAERAGDYVTQLELQNKLLENQKQTIVDLQLANDKIHNEAVRVRAASEYGDASNTWFDASGNVTPAYTNLLQTFAGKTDTASHATYEQITDLFSTIQKLKQGWLSNNTAIETMNDTLYSTEQKIKEIKEAQQKQYEDAQDMLMEYLKKYYETQQDAEDERHETVIKNIDKEIKKLEEKYALEDYNSDISERDKAILKKQMEIAAIAMDNSIEGNAKRSALQEELDALLLDKNKTVEEKKRENALETLDNEKEAEDERYEYESKILDKLSSENELFNQTQIDLAEMTTAQIIAKYEEMGAAIGGVYASSIQNAKLLAAISPVTDPSTSTETSTPKYYLVNRDWSTPAAAKDGDFVVTGGGIYKKGDKGYRADLPGGKTFSNYNDLEAFFKANFPQYKDGGAVTKTGLIWGDGTKTKPEYMLKNMDFMSLTKIMDAVQLIIPNIANLGKTALSTTNTNQNSVIHSEINIYSVPNENVDTLTNRIKTEIWVDFDKQLGLAGIK